ncbi:HEPN domain-containing protein [Enterococcus cecorum]|uniref:Uncharacterized protein n=1 Tax=Enterococcus cecorum TaxID=44008 RepID=A0A200HS22_9ENTE|nr:HEPN domain-containing protein [Enterococcus cecorum]OUZ14857.1 hypothetical protein A5869_001962 [Enterococcus cecorum]
MEAEKLTELLDQYESKSNWDRYFADTIAVDDLSDKWNKLYGFRNQVEHTKKITKTDYNAACAIIDELKPAFLQSLQLINTISMTVEESEAVEEVAEQTIAPKTVIVRGGREGNPLLYSNGYSQITPETLGNALLTIGSVGEKLIDRDSAIWGISSGLVKFAEAMTLSVDPEVKNGIIRLAESAIKPADIMGLISGLGKLAIDSSPYLVKDYPYTGSIIGTETSSEIIDKKEKNEEESTEDE